MNLNKVIDSKHPNIPKYLTQPLKNKAQTTIGLPVPSAKPRVFVLSIGVNSNNSDSPLFYADKDAQDFSDTFVQKTDSNKQVYSIVLKNAQANNESIMAAFKWLSQAVTSRDSVNILFSGHGFVDYRTQHYYFLSYDKAGRITTNNLLSDVWITDLISSLSGDVQLFIDSCYSSNYNDYLFVHVPTLKAKSFVSYSSSLSWRSSYESLENKNGFFTFSILEGLKGKADKNKDGLLTPEELFLYAKIVTPKLSNGLQSPDFLQYHR